MKRTEKLSFELAIPLSFEVLAILPDFVAWGVVFWFKTFVEYLFLRFLGMREVLLVHSHQFLEFGKWFFCGSWFWLRIQIFFVKTPKMISAVELEMCSRCWRFWHCYRQTLPLKKVVPNHFAWSWQRLGGRLPLYYSTSQSGRLSIDGKR